MANYTINEALKTLAKKVMDSDARFAHLCSEDCRIAFQYSSESKTNNGRLVYADTEKIKDKLKSIAPYDFIITFYEPNTSNLSNDKMEKLMHHELCHVGYKGEGQYFIIPHDVEDFRSLIDAWGLDWI